MFPPPGLPPPEVLDAFELTGGRNTLLTELEELEVPEAPAPE